MIRNLKLGLLTLVLAGGCAQILGISDYEIDPSLNDGEGGDGSASGGNGQEGGSGGSTTQGGEPTTGGNEGDGGEPVVGGGAPVGGSGEGGASGELVPCDSPACCAAEGGTPIGGELLQDGGFELGTYAEGNTPWEEYSEQGYAIITDGFAEMVTPRVGQYMAFLAGVALEISTLQSETLSIPPNSGWFEVSGYRWFEIDDTDPVNEDFMSIGLFNFATDDLEELPFFWELDSATGSWTRFSTTFNASPHGNKDLYLLLLATTDDIDDGSIPLGGSNFMMDEVSLKLFSCFR
jgi:hypothetical protein